MGTMTLLISAAYLAGAPIPKELRTNVSTEGKWKCVDYYTNGIRADMSTLTWNITGQDLTIERENVKIVRPKPYAFTQRKDEGPNAYDYKISAASTPRHCYVEVKGDTMKVAMPRTIRGERPTNAEPNEGVIYYEFKRVK